MFQFFFKTEDDLAEILKVGVWTQDDWCVVMERWIEKPPDDYLWYLPIWIRLRNIPVNYYTKETISEIAECVGEVLEVVFDSEKARVQDYVRVRVLFHVSKPLRNSKEVQLPTGEVVLITFDYERIRKRCFQCQRLTHDKNRCPFKMENSTLISDRILQDKGKQKEVLLKDLDLIISKPAGSGFMADARKGLASSSMMLASGNQFDDLSDGMPDLDVLTGFSSGCCEASTSGTSFKTHKMKKPNSSWSRKGKSGKELPLKDKGVLSWNCQGLRNPWTIRYLKEMKKDHFPDILFLMETMNSSEFVSKVFRWLGYDHMHTIDPEGRSGGLAIFWKSHLEIEFLFEDKNLLDLQVSQRNKVWFLSCIYGHPVTTHRPELWDRLSSIGLQRKKAWCMIGDFNDIRSNSEKLGGPSRLISSFQPFQDMLMNCDMHELGSSGNGFTWGGNRNDQWIQCRLDRSFGNSAWFSLFPNSHQWFLESFGSDHRPVLVKFINDHELFRGQFRFDKRMADNPACKDTISRSWSSKLSQGTNSSLFSLVECRRAISVWKQSSDSNAQRRILRLRKELDEQKSAYNPCWPRIASIKDQLAIAYGEEETFWRQKSRHKWLVGGDRNTGFFHATVKANRTGNALSFLLDEHGKEHTRNSDKGKVAASYFENLFSSSCPEALTDYLEGFQARVSTIMNQDLTKIVTEEEVHQAVLSINSESAPGPDGFTALFFQQNWALVKTQILQEIFGFFQNGVLPQEWNHTLICLIPKITKPQRMSDLRPISLCSVLYKIIAKILTARLKKHLPAIVSPTQSAFVPDRLVSDNILVAHEIIHSLRTNEKISKEYMAFKTDMSKAYDRVEWSFLEGMMVALGFNRKWISWIMACVSSVSYSVLINGQLINLDKSAITFGKRIDEGIKSWIKEKSGIQLEGGTGKYLGLPECLSGSKKELFGFIKERLQSKLTGWYAKTLSQGGKEILLKSIALALPVYAMTCFKLPILLCKKLTAVMMDFWWNNLQNARKIHWVGWQRLTLPKLQGGIGFKDLQCFNQALLAKQAWRLVHEKDSLFFKVFKSRYFLNCDFLNATKGTRPSYAWRSILFGRELLQAGLRTVIGNGKQTYVWIDKWVYDGQNRRPMNKQRLVDIKLKVSHLIDPFSRNWNLNMLRDLFPWKDIRSILNQRPVTSREDSVCWSYSTDGLYSVKSGYEFISRKIHHKLFKDSEFEPSFNPLFTKIWSLHTAPKIKIFLWKILNGAVAVEDRLRTRGIKIADGCLMCEEDQETINHILFQCPLARQVWALSTVPTSGNGYGGSIYANLNHLLDLTQNQDLSSLLKNVSPWILWVLWKNRNKILFEGTGSVTNSIVDKAFEDCHEWCIAQENNAKILKDISLTQWKPPIHGELKCNIGYAWSKRNFFSGASWVVRDSAGSVLLHSRRSFAQVYSLSDAKLKSWEWAIASMDHHHLDKVTFAASSYEIIKALHKPKDWPILSGHIYEMLTFTKQKPYWFLLMEAPHCNKGAMEIATSVITGNRFQSYVARDELWDELQNMALGREEPELFIPQEAYASVEARNRLSLIARPLNPRVQNLNSVIAALPRTWGLNTRVHGRILDATYVQFLFQTEVDLLTVQRREPWLFNNWFIASQRWEAFPAVNFLTTIDLWVQMRGIPLLYVCEETAVEIAQDLGEIITLDYHDATTTQIAYIRVRIRFGITDRLRFFQRITFDSGETALIRFQYERLRRICSSCFRFTHHRNYCPYRQRVHNYGRERAVFHDELFRSSLNSQSQMTDNSFPAPLTPPPRVATPPLNPEEQAAASPYFPIPRATSSQSGAASFPHGSSRRQQVFSNSNISLSSGDAITSGAPRVVEVGESSRRGEAGVSSNNLETGESSKRKNLAAIQREEEARHQKQKVFEQMMGGILKPPKKR
ncbi:Endonuclease/exonuclease/phosphatase [Arabidopsis thaliana x Arabidopsis arenosa]|uniref:Endonuclease/exonuclease/phosphatase n=1 Tax=Arabidopsis thaliana x Arabidopsis arenosa TaxID=1240361 RepID=A0A8T1XEF6_9BRAS|nr:Endonuclease/exonuclease/phosphatase [Arabidopsis thaliana x Arabidopsis arenosa]